MPTDNKHKKIIKYLNAMGLNELKNSFVKYLADGFLLSAADIEKMLKFIKYKDVENLSQKLLEILSDLKNNVTLQHKKNTLLKSSLTRVKKHRNSLKQKGYKNLSVNLSAEDTKKLKDLKLKKQMTHSQLISFLINQ
jgi:biotin operon repressor